MHICLERLPASGSIKVLLANIPDSIKYIVESRSDGVPDIDFISRSSEGPTQSTRMRENAIDVILLSVTPTSTHVDLRVMLRDLRRDHRRSRILFLAERPDYLQAISLFRLGGHGIFCSDNLEFELLCKSVRCIHEGQVWANNEITGYLVSYLSSPSPDIKDYSGRPLLTKREQQVLNLLADGLTNSELASTLNLSEHTIKNHLFRIYDKLGVSSRMEAVLYALTPRLTDTVEPIVPMSTAVLKTKSKPVRGESYSSA